MLSAKDSRINRHNNELGTKFPRYKSWQASTNAKLSCNVVRCWQHWSAPYRHWKPAEPGVVTFLAPLHWYIWEQIHVMKYRRPYNGKELRMIAFSVYLVCYVMAPVWLRVTEIIDVCNKLSSLDKERTKWFFVSFVCAVPKSLHFYLNLASILVWVCLLRRWHRKHPYRHAPHGEGSPCLHFFGNQHLDAEELTQSTAWRLLIPTDIK